MGGRPWTPRDAKSGWTENVGDRQMVVCVGENVARTRQLVERCSGRRTSGNIVGILFPSLAGEDIMESSRGQTAHCRARIDHENCQCWRSPRICGGKRKYCIRTGGQAKQKGSPLPDGCVRLGFRRSETRLPFT